MPLVMTHEDVLAMYAQGPDAVVTLALVDRVNALAARVEALEAERAGDSHTRASRRART